MPKQVKKSQKSQKSQKGRLGKSRTRKVFKQYGGAAIHTAVMNRNIVMINRLIDRGINVNQLDEDGNTPLMLACDSDFYIDIYSNIIRILLNVPNINVNLQDFDGKTALMMACSHDESQNRIEIVQMLLNNPNINVNIQTHIGRTALNYAATNDNVEITRLLLNTPGINVNLRDNYGQSIPYAAASEENPEDGHRAIRLILQHPDLNLTTIEIEEIEEILDGYNNDEYYNDEYNNEENNNELDYAPVIYRPGMAIEIHTKFARVNYQNFINIMKDMIGNKDTQIPNNFNKYIKDTLLSFVNVNDVTTRDKLERISERYFNSRVSNYEDFQRKLIFYSLEYVKTQENVFKENYVQAFAVDCTEAYNYNSGNRMSCGAGVKERLVLSLESAIASTTELTPDYRRILHSIDSTKYSLTAPIHYTELFNQFGSVCKEFTTKQAFMECIKSKIREELRDRYDEVEISRQLEEYIQYLDFNNAPLLGGKRTYKQRKISQKRHKNYKK